MSRSLRRHHRARLKRARKNYHSPPGWTHSAATVAKYADTPTPCSCWMCGNQRHAFGRNIPTIQENRWLSRADYQVLDAL